METLKSALRELESDRDKLKDMKLGSKVHTKQQVIIEKRESNLANFFRLTDAGFDLFGACVAKQGDAEIVRIVDISNDGSVIVRSQSGNEQAVKLLDLQYDDKLNILNVELGDRVQTEKGIFTVERLIFPGKIAIIENGLESVIEEFQVIKDDEMSEIVDTSSESAKVAESIEEDKTELGEALWKASDEDEEFRTIFSYSRKGYIVRVDQFYQGGFVGFLEQEIPALLIAGQEATMKDGGTEILYATERGQYFHSVRSAVCREYHARTKELESGFIGDYPPHLLPFLDVNREVYHPGRDGEDITNIQESLQNNGGVILQRVLVGLVKNDENVYDLEVVAGNRRTQAAVIENISTIPVEVRPFGSIAEVVEALLDTNDKTRDRNQEMKIREIAARKQYCATLARDRQARVSKKDASQSGKAWDEAARGSGLSGKTAYEASKLLDWIDTLPDANRIKLRELFNKNDKMVATVRKLREEVYQNPNYGAKVAMQVADLILRGEATSVEKALSKLFSEKQSTPSKQGAIGKAASIPQQQATQQQTQQLSQPVDGKTVALAETIQTGRSLIYPEQQRLDIEKHIPLMSDQWYTPDWLVETIAEVLGEIDIDPCADPGKRIAAKHHFTGLTEELNGLTQDWQIPDDNRPITFFANIPYSDPEAWLKKIEEQVGKNNIKEGVVLAKQGLKSNKGSGAIAKRLFEITCDMTGRVAFSCPPEHRKYREELKKNNDNLDNPNFDVVLLYIGNNWRNFYEKFDEYGDCRLAVWAIDGIEEQEEEEEIEWLPTKSGAVSIFRKKEIILTKIKGGKFRITIDNEIIKEGIDTLALAKEQAIALV
jgi:hypothetical protein